MEVVLIRAQIGKINKLKAQIKADADVILNALGAGPLPAGEEANLTASLTTSASKALADLSQVYDTFRDALAL